MRPKSRGRPTSLAGRSCSPRGLSSRKQEPRGRDGKRRLPGALLFVLPGVNVPWAVEGQRRIGPVELQPECVCLCMCVCGGGGSQLPLRTKPQSCGNSPLPDLPRLSVAKVRLEAVPALSQWDLKPQIRVKGSQQALTSQPHTQTLHHKGNDLPKAPLWTG